MDIVIPVYNRNFVGRILHVTILESTNKLYSNIVNTYISNRILHCIDMLPSPDKLHPQIQMTHKVFKGAPCQLNDFYCFKMLYLDLCKSHYYNLLNIKIPLIKVSREGTRNSGRSIQKYSAF